MSDPTSSFQALPPCADAMAEPDMNTAESLTGIFFEPGRVFESMREHPRFLVAAIIMVVAFVAYTTLFFQRVGYERVVRETIENSRKTEQMTPEEREQAIQLQSGPIFKAFAYASPVIVVAILIAAGAALYLLGSMIMAKKLSYMQALAIWTYSSMPPILLSMLLNIVLIFLESPDDYDVVNASRRGLVKANLGTLTDPKAAPVLATLLGSIDLFAFYGLFLAALGLRKVGKMSSGSGWAIVITIWIIGIVVRMSFAGLFGTAM
jgi:Yip1-like protein